MDSDIVGIWETSGAAPRRQEIFHVDPVILTGSRGQRGRSHVPVSPKTIDNADQRKPANLSSMFLAFSAAVQNSRPGRGSARAPPGGVRVRQRFLRVGALWCFCHGSFRCSHSATSRTPSGCWVFLVGSFKIFLRWCFVGAFFLSGSGFLLSNFSRIFRRIIDE